VDFAFSDEQNELRAAVRRFCEDKSPEDEVRRLMEPQTSSKGYDERVWTQMAEQIGLQGLAIPEIYGGAGFSFADLCIVLEEMGRALYCGPFFSSAVMAATLLMHSSDEGARSEILASIAAGTTIGTVAMAESNGRFDRDGIEMRAGEESGAYLLSGEKQFVLDGAVADLILVLANTPEGLSLFSVPSDAPGVSVHPAPTLDQTCRQATIKFVNTPARLIGQKGEASAYFDHWMDQVVVALAAEAVGGAEACLDMAVSYAKDRVQFGRPIGSFQAIKHKCADVLVSVESAKSAAYYAAWAAGETEEELHVVAPLAKAYCSNAYFFAAAENIQIHGGIGFTWEHPAHLYFKRAKSSEQLFGDPTYQRNLVAQRIGI
jgi:alkylation response protein AidB-like acyl-CoA dehydrogenase